MWSQSFTVSTTEVNAGQVWKVLADVSRWHEWDSEIEWTRIDGLPGLNQDFYLKPKGGPKTRITISGFEEPGFFADISHLLLGKMVTSHTLTQNGPELTIRVEIRITGLLTFLWKKVIGENQISGGPEQTRRLIEKAKLK